MMYYVFVHQPFATLICRGLLPAVFTDQQFESFPVKAYIYALDEYKRAADYSYEWHQEYANQRTFGNMPKVESLPFNALIGTVTIVGPTDIPGFYLIRNAHEFIAPIDWEFDEIMKHEDYIERVNTKMFIPRVPHFIDECSNLIVPLNPFIHGVASFGGAFNVELVGSFAKLVLDENEKLKPFTKFTIWHGNDGMSFVVDDGTKVLYELVPNGSDLKRYPSLLSQDGTTTRSKLCFSCHIPLTD